MRRYFSSKSLTSETPKETEANQEPRFHWRTRVNSLMNEGHDGKYPYNDREKSQSLSLNSFNNDSKEAGNDNSFDKRRESSANSPPTLHPSLPLGNRTDGRDLAECVVPNDTTLGSSLDLNQHLECPKSSVHFKDYKYGQNVDSSTKEKRKERFSRAKSDSHLKRRVKFRKEEYLENSKSFDAGDEIVCPSTQYNSGSRFRCLRSKDSYDSDTSKGMREGHLSVRRRSYVDSSHGDIYTKFDNYDDEYLDLGACGVSYDSGLELRGSISSSEDEDDIMTENYLFGRGRVAESEIQESAHNIVFDSFSPKLKHSKSIAKQKDRDKMQLLHDLMHTDYGSDQLQKIKHETFADLCKATMKNENITVDDAYDDDSNERNLAGNEEDYFPGGVRAKGITDVKEVRVGDREITPPYQLPGYSFFHDGQGNQIKEIEEVLDKIISEEEAAVVSNDKILSKDRIIGGHGGCLKTQSQGVLLIKSPTTRMMADQQETINQHMKNNEYNYEFTRRDNDLNDNDLIDDDGNDDIDDDDNYNYDEEEGKESEWACVPKILLEDIFTLLTPKGRHEASQVCKHWYDLFYSPRVWETFILLERTLTKKRFNLYKGYQRELCPWKTQLCLRRVGSYFKRIVITPITDYFNLCEFLRILAAFLRYQEEHGENAMPLLHTFDFTFACATRGEDGIMVHGTGGQILDMIIQLLIQMRGLKHLKLNQLLTDVAEVHNLLHALTKYFPECLNSLEMLNVTKVPFPLTDICHFRNLIKLAISPQHLNEEALILIAGLNLMHLYLVQDIYTCECDPVSYEAWKLVKEMAPWLRVYLEVTGNTRVKPLIQPRAPVYGVFLRTPYSRLNNDLLTELVDQYSKTLRYLVQERLPRVHGPRHFDKRCDSSLLFLVRRCTNLHTLVVSERLSTATLLLIANDATCLSTLLVRQNALIKRCDWSSCGEWSRGFYQRLKINALNYDRCTNEICTILRHRWRPLSDKQFMHLKIMPKLEMC